VMAQLASVPVSTPPFCHAFWDCGDCLQTTGCTMFQGTCVYVQEAPCSVGSVDASCGVCPPGGLVYPTSLSLSLSSSIPSSPLYLPSFSSSLTAPGFSGSLAISGQSQGLTGLNAQQFMAAAASGAQFEIQASQLALENSQNPAVRSLATTLITDHTRLGQQLFAAASTAGLIPPQPIMNAQDAAAFIALQTNKVSFDLAWEAAQWKAHTDSLTLMQDYAQNGAVPALQSFALTAIPVIQQHLAILQSMGAQSL